MKLFNHHMVAFLLSLTLLVRFLAPSWGELTHCDDQMFMQKTTCCQQMLASDSSQEEETNGLQIAQSHGNCCCELQSQVAKSQDMQVHIPSADLRFQPMVLALLDIIIGTVADEQSLVAITHQPDKPAYSSRHILALQSVLLI
ncbi:MAG: hypothetical protein RR212_10625 [Bacteroidales bacterium]